ncbi:MAG: hypothetical protein WDN26_05575 [Chitinophagaceae bacterium]
MKILTTAFIALFVSATLFSCKKDKDATPANVAVEGKWEGTYINSASGNSFFFSFNFKSGGVMEEIDSNGEKIGEGTWTFENNILMAKYHWLPPYSSSYSVIAAYYKNTGKLLGDWGYGNSNNDGGTWQMTKKN